MNPPVAIIGWGSLIWDLDDLAPHVTGEWRMGAGPRLPMEFSRVSPKRKRSLVVILDPDDGVACATCWIASARAGVAAAAADLARRERCAEAMIGAVCLATGSSRGRVPIVEAVRAWCRGAGLAGAVWTELLPDFAEHTGTAFGLGPALDYLGGLGGESLAEAVRYISNAPLRRALAAEPWWQELAARN